MISCPSARLGEEPTVIPGVTPDSGKNAIYSILSREQIKIFEESPDTRYELDFAYSIDGVGRFRC